MNNEEAEIQDFIPQDTKDIQIQSVCAFMEQFNYLLHIDGKFYSNTFWDWEKGGRDRPTFKGCEVLSMNTAVKLHNYNWNIASILNVVPSQFHTDRYTINKANAAKIVKQVFCKALNMVE